jgi:3-hydroxymyristoyl/3-hydroxydecanoyl-(acyl carrier protein) dehydratase
MIINKAGIEAIIPHRGLLSLLDEIREHTATSGVGVHYVKDDEFWCAGHFPGNPIMPGVLQVEAMAQVACFLAIKNLIETGKGRKVGYFTGIEKVKFLKMVKPGDTLILYVEQTAQKLNLYKFQGYAMVGDVKVCEASFAALMNDWE